MTILYKNSSFQQSHTQSLYHPSFKKELYYINTSMHQSSLQKQAQNQKEEEEELAQEIECSPRKQFEAAEIIQVADSDSNSYQDIHQQNKSNQSQKDQIEEKVHTPPKSNKSEEEKQKHFDPNQFIQSPQKLQRAKSKQQSYLAVSDQYKESQTTDTHLAPSLCNFQNFLIQNGNKVGSETQQTSAIQNEQQRKEIKPKKYMSIMELQEPSSRRKKKEQEFRYQKNCCVCSII